MHHADSALTTECGQTPWSQRKPDRAAERAAKYIPLAGNSTTTKTFWWIQWLCIPEKYSYNAKGENWKNRELTGLDPQDAQ